MSIYGGFVEQESGYEFSSASSNPSLPLKKFGRIEPMGWNTQVLFAIDNNNQIWMSGFHSNILYPSDIKALIFEREGGYCNISVNDILDVLGFPRKITDFEKIGSHNGLIPTNEWDR